MRHPMKLTAVYEQSLLPQVKANPGVILRAFTGMLSVSVAEYAVYRALATVIVTIVGWLKHLQRPLHSTG